MPSLQIHSPRGVHADDLTKRCGRGIVTLRSTSMKTTARLFVTLLGSSFSLLADPLKGSFLLSSESTETPSRLVSLAKGRASLTSADFRLTADEISLDQSTLDKRGVSVLTCRGVTSVSSGYSIPTSGELTLEVEGLANIYRLNPAGIVAGAIATNRAETSFSKRLPPLDLSLRAASPSN